MQVSSGRSEKRISITVEVMGYRADGTSLPEGTFTENVSMRGARMVTKSKLEPGKMIEVYSPYDGLRRHARVVYCHTLFGGKFAVGVEMQTQKVPRKNES